MLFSVVSRVNQIWLLSLYTLAKFYTASDYFPTYEMGLDA